MTKPCNFDALCWQHGGHDIGNSTCSKKAKALRLERRIARKTRRHDLAISKLEFKRDEMRVPFLRTIWRIKK